MTVALSEAKGGVSETGTNPFATAQGDRQRKNG
jgi:hypothetical protein